MYLSDTLTHFQPYNPLGPIVRKAVRGQVYISGFDLLLTDQEDLMPAYVWEEGMKAPCMQPYKIPISGFENCIL